VRGNQNPARNLLVQRPVPVPPDDLKHPVNQRMHRCSCPPRHGSHAGTRLRAFLLTLAALYVAHCGKVGPPLPPEVLIPKPVSDLSARQIGNDIKLSWTLPTLNLNGTKATSLQRMEIYRQIVPLPSATPAVEEISKQFQGSRIMSIDTVHLAAFSEQGQVVFADQFPGLNPESLQTSELRYAVKVINKKRQDGGFSNIVARRWLPVPPAVPHVDFKAEETAIILSWEAPRQNGSSPTSIVGYNVYRSQQSHVVPAAPLHEKPVPETRYEDHHFQFGTTYYYTVRSVVQADKVTAESSDSPESAFKPVDVFPPRTPSGLIVVFADGKMNLLWDPNPEPDFAGYRVYRSEDGVGFDRMTESLLKSPTYRDEKIQAGKRYFYRVSAVDNSGNESPPTPAVSQIAEGG
jgi:hypothetical protein